MILHSVTVENWRCFVGKTTVGPFSEHLNLLYAPNATGKSTLFEALRCALMDNHGTQGEDVQQLRPWGRELSPRVMVEFSAKGCRYRVGKRFLDRPESLIERMEEGSYKALAEGPKADSATRELFTPNAPKKGMSRPEHWGIQQVLWTPQGNLELDSLSGDLLAGIRQALSIQVVDSSIRAVEERLNSRYGTYFTLKGRLRTGSGASSLPGLEGSIRAIEEELESRMREYRETEILSANLKALSSRVEGLKDEARHSAENLKELEKKADDYRSLIRELEKSETEAKAAESEYLRLKGLFDQVSDIRREMGTVEEKITPLQRSLPGLEEELKICSGRLEARKTEFAAARKAMQAGEIMLSRARKGLKLFALQEKIRKGNGTLKEAQGAKTAIEAAESERAERTFPGFLQIKEIRKAFETLEEAKIMLDASMVTLEITPAVPIKARIDSGETPGSVTLEPGKKICVKGAPEVSLEVEFFGKIHAFGPCQKTDEVKTAFEEACCYLHTLSEPYGTSNKKELEELYERDSELERQSEKEKVLLSAILGGDSLAFLEESLNQAQKDADTILECFPEWIDNPQDPQKLEKEAVTEIDAAAEKVHFAESARDTAQELVREKEREFERERLTLESLEERQRKLGEKLCILQIDGKSLKERQTEVSTVFNRWDLFRARSEEYRKELALFDGNPVESLKKNREADKVRSAALQEAEKDLAREETRLEIASGKGLYSLITVLEENCEELRRMYRAEKIAAESIKLLWSTYGACRQELADTVNRVVEEKATKIVERIAGTRKGRLVLDEGMLPSTFLPGESDKGVDVKTLSGGEREQIHLAVRLALADAAGSGERQLLVLDDILMATDSLRFPRILEILEECSENLQILILTCQPERFATLTGASSFDLEALRA